MLYLIDKRQAIKNNYRISENILLSTVIIGGTIGALSSMIINRHKIKKLSFIIKYLIANILSVVLVYNIFERY